MSICETCNSEHDGSYGSGRFCDSKCARSYSTKAKRKEISEKVSRRLKGKPTYRPPHKSRKIKECESDKCNKKFEIIITSDRRFCSKFCSSYKTKLEKHVKENNYSKISYCEKCEKVIKSKRRFCSRQCFISPDKSEKEQYKHDCKFIFNVYHYPDEFDIQLVEKYGWYKATNKGDNLNGISRDHKISVSHGFKNNIDPEIISHPANCQLMRHSENNLKKTKCSISLNKLLVEIENWNGKYGELPESGNGSVC